MGKLDELGDAVRSVIRAFHGSPHDFDRFDAGKIGTGEGAQAYGHGLYFAGNENVARSYRDIAPAARTPEQQAIASEARSRYMRSVAEEQELAKAIEELHKSRGVLTPGWGNIRSVPSSDPELSVLSSRRAALQSKIDELAGEAAAAALARGPRPDRGRMYEVAIDRPESSLLDWDAPISRQPKVVQKVFGDFAMDELGDGGRIYRDIATRHGEAFDDDMTGVLANLEASKELLAEGVPGIRYLDQGSRSAGQGTRNYVMFPGTEDSIRILRKYAIPGAVGVGAAAGDE